MRIEYPTYLVPLESLDEYSEFVESMILTKGFTRMYENTLGLVGEAGEVAEKIKKFVRDGTLDDLGMQKELGDVLFYWIALHNHFGYDPVETIKINMAKLENRKLNSKLQGSGDDR